MTINSKDDLYDVISKLSTISDFFEMFDDEKFSMRKLTPSGFNIILGECIRVLQAIGGFNEQPS